MSDGQAHPELNFGSRISEALAAEGTPRRAELYRLAGAARQVIEHLAATAAPIEALRDAADSLELVAEAIGGHPRRSSYEGFAESANSGDTHGFFDHSPLIGMANPIAPPLQMEVDGATVRGRGSFGSAYEGPPGCVHGGYVAAAFDEVLGMAQSMSGNPGMTGTLTVRYRRPTPLHQDLRFEATLDRVEGRKIFCSGQCYVGDTLTAEAEAVFISVDFARMAALLRDREEQGPG